MKIPLGLQIVFVGFACLLASCAAVGPVADGGKANIGSVEEQLRKDEDLIALDQKLKYVLCLATRQAPEQNPATLEEDQQEWIRRRHGCWQNADWQQCLKNIYRLRIAELQARYQLIAETATVRYVCDDNPNKVVKATFYKTDPPTLVAEYKDTVSIMSLRPSGSGARYEGPDTSLWDHHGRALISWGEDSTEMRCVEAPLKAAPTVPGPGL